MCRYSGAQIPKKTCYILLIQVINMRLFVEFKKAPQALIWGGYNCSICSTFLTLLNTIFLKIFISVYMCVCLLVCMYPRRPESALYLLELKLKQGQPIIYGCRTEPGFLARAEVFLTSVPSL